MRYRDPMHGALLSLLIACSADTPVSAAGAVRGVPQDSGDSGLTGTQEVCDAEVAALSPADGSVDLSPEAPLVLELTAPGEAELWLDGAAGSVEVSGNGRVYRFVPEAPLAWSAGYTLHASVCGQEVQSSFRTVSGPVAGDLEGRRYALDLQGQDIRWEEPEEVGALFLSFAETTLLQIEVRSQGVEAGAPLLGLSIYPAWDEAEDGRGQAVHMEPVDFSRNPLFSAAAPLLALPAEENELMLSDLVISGHFTPDGGAIEGLRVEALLNTQNLQRYGLDICDTLSCVECPGSRNETCLPLVFSDPWLPLIGD